MLLLACLVCGACGTRAAEAGGGEGSRLPAIAAERAMSSRPAALLPFRGAVVSLPAAVSSLYSWVLQKGYFHGGPPFLMLERIPDVLAEGEISGTLYFPLLMQKGNSSGVPFSPVSIEASEGQTPAGNFFTLSWEGPLAEIDGALRHLQKNAADEGRVLEGRLILMFTDTLQDEEKRTIRLMADFHRQKQ
jgi:hypothetical protein